MTRLRIFVASYFVARRRTPANTRSGLNRCSISSKNLHSFNRHSSYKPARRVGSNLHRNMQRSQKVSHIHCGVLLQVHDWAPFNSLSSCLWLRYFEHVREDWGLRGENAAEEPKVRVLCFENDVPVDVPYISASLNVGRILCGHRCNKWSRQRKRKILCEG